jgi:hypothetical protein
MKAKTRTESAVEKTIIDNNISTRQRKCGHNELENLKIKKSSFENESFSTAC